MVKRYGQQEMKKVDVIQPFRFISITRKWEVWMYLADLLVNINQQLNVVLARMFEVW